MSIASTCQWIWKTEEPSSEVNICGAITYIAFLVVYIFAFIASKKVTDEEEHQHEIINGHRTTPYDDPLPVGIIHNFLFMFHLVGLILLLLPAVFYVMIGFRENMRSKKIFPVEETGPEPTFAPA